MGLNFPCGGWCPKGRRAEDGTIPLRYPLRETQRPDYTQRTARNVIDSDGTLILTRGRLRGGTALTAELARRKGRAFLVLRLGDQPPLDPVLSWLHENDISILNVAGPRESQCPGIGREAREFMERLLPACSRGRNNTTAMVGDSTGC